MTEFLVLLLFITLHHSQVKNNGVAVRRLLTGLKSVSLKECSLLSHFVEIKKTVHISPQCGVFCSAAQRQKLTYHLLLK